MCQTCPGLVACETWDTTSQDLSFFKSPRTHFIAFPLHVEDNFPEVFPIV